MAVASAQMAIDSPSKASVDSGAEQLIENGSLI